jgi:hypothetical protein
MADIFCEWASDFLIDQNGDIQLATGWDETSQKIQRDLLTNPAVVQGNGIETEADYVFHPDYGVGLRQFLGKLDQPAVISAMRNKTLAQLNQDSEIAKQPGPVVTFRINNPFVLQIFIQVFLVNAQPGVISTQPSQLGLEISP